MSKPSALKVRLLRLRDFLKRFLGVDRAVAYTVLARGFQIVGSTGTVLLILHFLSPLEQGYYYTLLSLVNLQTIFELGFSFVILQLAAHERVQLTIHDDGQVSGGLVAHARLASILQNATRWYMWTAALMGAILLPMGFLFFSQRPTASEVAWQVPWVLAVLACSAGFTLNPLIAFLEGCGQVRQVACMRLGQAIAALVMAWTAMVIHRGLYAPAMVLLGYTGVGLVFLWRRRAFLWPLFTHPVKEHTIAWRAEVWSFQWKIAITWLSSYFTVQVFTPILFAFSGPVEAGRMGMSVSVAGYLWNVVLPWMSTKAAPFGRMVASGEFDKLDELFFRTLRQSLFVLLVLATTVMAAVTGLHYVLPRLTSRLVSPGLFLLLLFATVGTFVTQSLSTYLRAHKSEPLLWQSIVVALITVVGALLFVPLWGTAGATVIYFVSTGIIGMLWAAKVFHESRRNRANSRYRGLSPMPTP